MSKYLGLHRHQLFHWIGSHIESSSSGKLSNHQRSEYIKCLKIALNDKMGLWAKVPRDPDYLGDGSLIKINKPITCFTEWSLTQSRHHTSQYGRLGLGFSKKFVLDRSGQPVAYVLNKKDNPYTQSLLKIVSWFENEASNYNIPYKEIEILRDRLSYITQLHKSLRKPRHTKFKISNSPATQTSKKAKKNSIPDIYARRYGSTLHYFEEREWRIVFSSLISKHYNIIKTKDETKHYLKFTPGKDLFTVVVPDNETLNLAIRDSSIRNQLYPSKGPHVTLLSYQDIGTF